METSQTRLFGYFTDNSDTPTYDPGIDVPCILCFKPLNYPTRDVVTSSFSAFFDHDERSYFYRAHKDCYRTAEQSVDPNGDSDISHLEASVMLKLGNLQDFERSGLFTK